MTTIIDLTDQELAELKPPTNQPDAARRYECDGRIPAICAAESSEGTLGPRRDGRKLARVRSGRNEGAAWQLLIWSRRYLYLGAVSESTSFLAMTGRGFVTSIDGLTFWPGSARVGDEFGCNRPCNITAIGPSFTPKEVCRERIRLFSAEGPELEAWTFGRKPVKALSSLEFTL